MRVSFPPSVPSVKDIFVPATNLPFKKPAVVSLEDTFTFSVSALPKPFAVPLLVIVAPAGIVIVSPESPTCKAVPDCGITLSTSI